MNVARVADEPPHPPARRSGLSALCGDSLRRAKARRVTAVKAVSRLTVSTKDRRTSGSRFPMQVSLSGWEEHVTIG